jgi:hypothetical protein
MKHENALALAPTRTGGSAPFEGRWRNELNSEMVLRIKHNAVSGHYTSYVSSQHKKVRGPISGFVNGYTIAFVVTWPTASITAWVGQFVREKHRDVIETLWQLTSEVENPGDAKELWNSVNSGADRFIRASVGNKAKKKS